MARQPIRRPEAVRQGGFSGGQSTGATRPVAGSGLQDLAQALGQVGNAGRRFAFGKAQRQANEQQALRDSAAQDAAPLLQILDGYRSDEIKDAMADDARFAEVFEKNPFAEAVVQKFRGRQIRREMETSLAGAMIDQNDPGAVRAWVRENKPEISNPFIAAGYNEEDDRFDQQLQATQRKAIRAEADEARLGAVNEEFYISISQGGSVAEALARAREVATTVGLKGPEFNDLKMSFVKQAADAGDVNLVRELIETPGSNGVPPLVADARLKDEASEQLKMAEERARTLRARGEVSIIADFREEIRLPGRGMTLRQVKAHPAYAQLSDDGKSTVENMAISYERERSTKAEADAKDAEEALDELIREQLVIAAARNGNLNTIWDLKETEKQGVLRMFRSEYLNGNLTQGVDGMRDYVTALSRGDNGLVDDFLKDRFNSASNFLGAATPDLRENEDRLRLMVEQWQQVPLSLRGAYADQQNSAILDFISNSTDAGESPADAMERYRNMQSLDSEPSAKLVRQVMNGLQLDNGNANPFNDRDPVAFGDETYSQAWASDWVSENARHYKTRSDLRRAARQAFKDNHVSYNGRTIPLPTNPNGRPIDKDKWLDALDSLSEDLPSFTDEQVESLNLPNIPQGATDIFYQAMPASPDTYLISFIDPETGEPDTEYVNTRQIELYAVVNQQATATVEGTDAVEEAIARRNAQAAQRQRERRIREESPSARAAIGGQN